MPTLPPFWRKRLTNQHLSRVEAGTHRAICPSVGLDFCSNNYLGLKNDARLSEAAFAALGKYGAGAGGARLLRGTTPIHDELEASLARWKGTESCLLLNSGYQANSSIIPALAGLGDAIFSDALNHASLIDGCRMAKCRGAELFVYEHLNLGHLSDQLTLWAKKRKDGSAAMVISDAVFSMDGDLADLPGLMAICNEFEALLLTDEAHATGLLGQTGSGLAELQGVHGLPSIIMGTLGKALGCFGAFVCADSALIGHLANTCRGFLFSTALPASIAAAALKAIEVSQIETWRRAAALKHAAAIRHRLGLGKSSSAIVPVMLGSNEAAMLEAARLQENGFDVRAVRPPTVPPGTARLRITTNALQMEEDVLRLAGLLKGRQAIALDRSR